MEATLGSMNATPTGQTLVQLINTLEPLTVCHTKSEVRVSACRLVAALINKVPEGNGFSLLFPSSMLILMFYFRARARSLARFFAA